MALASGAGVNTIQGGTGFSSRQQEAASGFVGGGGPFVTMSARARSSSVRP